MENSLVWEGPYWGTEKGTATLTLAVMERRVSGQIFLNEPDSAQMTATVDGELTSDNKLEATLRNFRAIIPASLSVPSLGRLSATLDKESLILTGVWSTSDNAQGQFTLILKPRSRTDSPRALKEQTAPSEAAAPKPLVTVTIEVGAIRTDSEGLRNIVAVVQDELNVKDAAINTTFGGREVIHLGMDAVLADPALPAIVDTLIIAANENSINTGNRNATLFLRKSGPNSLFVSGWDRIWVEGKATQVKNVAALYESRAIGFWRRYGSNLNSVIFLALLALLPSIPSLGKRSIVVAVTFILLPLLMLSWKRVAHTRIEIHKERVGLFEKYAQWLIAALTVLATSAVAYLIQRYVTASHH